MNTIINIKDFQKYPDLAFHIGEIAGTEAAYPHSHDCVNLLFVTGGNSLYSIEQYTLTAIPGSVYGAAGDSVHYFNNKHKPQGFSILFDPVVLGDSITELITIPGYNELIVQNFNKYGYLSNFFLEPEPYEKIMSLLCRLYDEYNSDTASMALIRAFLIELIVELCRCYIDRKNKKSATMRLLFEDRSILNTAINEKMLISQIAEKSGLSEQHFRRLFHKAFGMSPSQYLHLRKVINAKNMILEGKYSITEIAMRCGFCNSSHMSRIFKKLEGVSPREYKKLHM